MSTAEIEVVEAFTSIGVTLDKAMSAAAALNKRDALLDVGSVRSELVGVKTDLGVLKTDVSLLKTDVSVLKADFALLKTDVSVLKTDVARLKTDVAVMKWICGFNTAMLIAVMLKLFLH
jgi:hypothetical protein